MFCSTSRGLNNRLQWGLIRNVLSQWLDSAPQRACIHILCSGMSDVGSRKPKTLTISGHPDHVLWDRARFLWGKRPEWSRGMQFISYFQSIFTPNSPLTKQNLWRSSFNQKQLIYLFIQQSLNFRANISSTFIDAPMVFTVYLGNAHVNI